jgi:hypothetical protein
MKKPITNKHLKTWSGLNEYIREADEDACRAILAEELRGRKRGQFVKRIHSRLNKVRADRERAELRSKIVSDIIN